MAKSGSLRLSDMRAIFRLVNECRELGDDSVAWRLRFASGLGHLTGGGMGIIGEMAGCDRGPRQDLGTAFWGTENGYDWAAWAKMLTTFHKNPLYNPLINSYIARMPSELGSCLARTDLLTDREWHQQADYLALHRSVGADETLVCFYPVPGAADEVSEVFLGREIGDRDFSQRDRAIVREAMAGIGPLIGGPLARFADPSPSGLAPRARAVLKCMLEGDSDKQVAARLGLTRNTVNQYAKTIYTHFGVRSRTELLARWVRRGWGRKLGWAD